MCDNGTDTLLVRNSNHMMLIPVKDGLNVANAIVDLLEARDRDGQ